MEVSLAWIQVNKREEVMVIHCNWGGNLWAELDFFCKQNDSIVYQARQLGWKEQSRCGPAWLSGWPVSWREDVWWFNRRRREKRKGGWEKRWRRRRRRGRKEGGREGEKGGGGEELGEEEEEDLVQEKTWPRLRTWGCRRISWPVDWDSLEWQALDYVHLG